GRARDRVGWPWAGWTCRERDDMAGLAPRIPGRHPGRVLCVDPARCVRTGCGYARPVQGSSAMTGSSQEKVAGANGSGPAPGTAEVVRFDLLGPPVLSRCASLRDTTLSHDVARQRAGWRTARVLVVDAAGRVPIRWTGRRPEGPWAMDTDGTAQLV